MKKINVISMGPGNKNYIIPEALKIIEDSEIIIGNERILGTIEIRESQLILPGMELAKIEKTLDERGDKKVSILVSGDAGFHSLLNWLNKKIGKEQINVIPGISSIHYFFARLNLSWEETAFISLHGRDFDFIPVVAVHKQTAILTDKKNTPRKIAERLAEHNYEAMTMYVGNRLSYNDEEIIKAPVKSFLSMKKEFDLAVVVVAHG